MSTDGGRPPRTEKPATEPAEPPPLFRVVKGSPTDEELAAIITVLIGGQPATPAAAPPAVSGWSAYWRGIRAPLAPGAGAWRASGRQ